MEIHELSRHLLDTENKFDITEIYDRSGYSPLHFTAYKNNEKMAEILCSFVIITYKLMFEIRCSENTKEILCLKTIV